MFLPDKGRVNAQLIQHLIAPRVPPGTSQLEPALCIRLANANDERFFTWGSSVVLFNFPNFKNVN